MSTQLDDIETRIVEKLSSMALDATQEAWTDPKWTLEIKRRIGLLGKERGYYVCATGWTPPDGQGEWLFDLVWLSVQNQLIIDVPLVLESEWDYGPKGICEDFSKLLLARAQHRVMIFNQKTLGEVEKIFDMLSGWVSAYLRGQRGDRYLLAGLDNTKKAFVNRLVIVP